MPYANAAAPARPQRDRGSAIASTQATGSERKASRFDAALPSLLETAGYPAKADPAQINTPLVIAILFRARALVTMVYGPIAALLVELFPTRIRYTVDVPALPHRQRLVRRLPADDRLRHRRRDGQYLRRAVVPGDLRGSLVIGLLFLPETRGRRPD